LNIVIDTALGTDVVVTVNATPKSLFDLLYLFASFTVEFVPKLFPFIYKVMILLAGAVSITLVANGRIAFILAAYPDHTFLLKNTFIAISAFLVCNMHMMLGLVRCLLSYL
jgi:hypothetical protein